MMNEMLASAPKASAPNLKSVSSSDAGLLLTSTPSHWSISNADYWVLDEDDSRTGIGRAQHNLAGSRRLAFNLLRREKSPKIGIAAKRIRAGRKTDCRLKVLSRLDAYSLLTTNL